MYINLKRGPYLDVSIRYPRLFLITPPEYLCGSQIKNHMETIDTFRPKYQAFLESNMSARAFCGCRHSKYVS